MKITRSIPRIIGGKKIKKSICWKFVLEYSWRKQTKKKRILEKNAEKIYLKKIYNNERIPERIIETIQEN